MGAVRLGFQPWLKHKLRSHGHLAHHALTLFNDIYVRQQEGHTCQQKTHKPNANHTHGVTAIWNVKRGLSRGPTSKRVPRERTRDQAAWRGVGGTTPGR